MPKRQAVFGALLLALLCMPIASISAQSPYRSYTYNAWAQSVPAPCGYLPEKSYSGTDLGVGPFSKPQDLFVDGKGDAYVLDSGNGRIVILDPQFHARKIISAFTFDGEPVGVNEPKGIFVDDQGLIYVADTGNGRVLVMDDRGIVRRIVGKPVSDVLPSGFSYSPQKVVVDSTGTMYVLAFGVFQGLVSFDGDGRFTGFYGSNRVQVTISLLADRIWKRILSREQRSKMLRYVPVEYSGIDLSSDDFVYTSTKSTYFDQLKKLNPMGVNVLVPRSTSSTARRFGDLESNVFKSAQITTNFVDVHVDGDGIISGLDGERGRVFQYDQDCDLLFAFGGIGDQVGTFRQPVAVESWGGRVLVLDTEKAGITTFALTDFGASVLQAVRLYGDGRYEEAVGPWTEVLKRDGNYELAYIGIGKALMKTGSYREAMRQFRLGYDRKGYSEAFAEYRNQLLRTRFSFFALPLIAVALAAWVLIRRRRRRAAPRQGAVLE